MTISNDRHTTIIWRKAAKSNGAGACVEVSSVRGTILVRDSKNPDGPVLEYTQAEWSAFLDGAKNGEFDSFCN
jgi:Domain of unknown function (DUF397)